MLRRQWRRRMRTYSHFDRRMISWLFLSSSSSRHCFLFLFKNAGVSVLARQDFENLLAVLFWRVGQPTHFLAPSVWQMHVKLLLSLKASSTMWTIELFFANFATCMFVKVLVRQGFCTLRADKVVFLTRDLGKLLGVVIVTFWHTMTRFDMNLQITDFLEQFCAETTK